MTAHFLQAFAEPEIAFRTCCVLAIASAGGLLLLVAWATLPRQGLARAVLLPAAQSGFVYLLAGLGSRFVIQHHRSRLQMGLLLGAVAGIEILRARLGKDGPRVATWLAGSVAVCLGVVAAKWALEPGVLSETLSRLRSADGDA